MLSRSGIINPDFLAGSQRCRHSFASRVNNVRSRAESETYRALLASDDNCLARLIGSYRAGLVSCARSRRGGDGLVDVVVSSVVVVLVCANANGATSPQTKAIIVFFILSSFLIKLPPQFVTQHSNGRSLSVFIFTRPVVW